MGERDDARRSIEDARERMSEIAEELARRANPDRLKAKAKEEAVRRGRELRDRAVVRSKDLGERALGSPIVGGAVGGVVGTVAGSLAARSYGRRIERRREHAAIEWDRGEYESRPVGGAEVFVEEESRPYGGYPGTSGVSGTGMGTGYGGTPGLGESGGVGASGVGESGTGYGTSGLRESGIGAGGYAGVSGVSGGYESASEPGIRAGEGASRGKAEELRHKAVEKGQELRERAAEKGHELRERASHVREQVRERIPSGGEIKERGGEMVRRAKSRPAMLVLGGMLLGAIAAMFIPVPEGERRRVAPVKGRAKESLRAATERFEERTIGGISSEAEGGEVHTPEHETSYQPPTVH